MQTSWFQGLRLGRVAAGVVLAGACFGASAISATAGPTAGPAAGAAPSPIKHVVFIYKENKTFDDVFAQFCQQHPTRCTPPRAKVTTADGNTVALTPHGDLAPYVGHSDAMQTLARANQWDQIQGCGPPEYNCLTYEAASNEPNTLALANSFAISGSFFSAAGVPSFGGHLEMMTGGLDGFTGDNPPAQGQPGWGCDSGRMTDWTTGAGHVRKEYSCVPDPALPIATYPYGGAAGPTPVHYQPTIFDRCEAVPGCTWRMYAQGLDPASSGGPYVWNSCTYVAECLYTSQDSNDVPHDQVITDAQAGTLPSISYVMPGEDANGIDDSGHNQQPITVEDDDIGSIVSAIENGPDWSSTAIFVTWDDCGCFYDHVTPPANLGPRLPLIAISPYARPAYTDHKTATQYSILAYIEHTFGLAPLTPADRRAYDLSRMFNYSQTPLGPVATVYRPMPAGEHPAAGLAPDDNGS